jgi:hypothetical protein
MPYIIDKERRAIDPKIDALLKYAFGANPDVAVVKKENGIFFWYHFLDTLYIALGKRVVGGELTRKVHYHEHNALHGVYQCALEELFNRWNEAYGECEFIPLKMHAPAQESVDAYTAGIANRFTKKTRLTIEQLVHDLVLSFSADFLGHNVGEINYAIAEVANALGNTKRAEHQEMLDAFVTANHAHYRTHVFPYEKEAATKNGDTRGFTEFWRIIKQRLESR